MNCFPLHAARGFEKIARVYLQRPATAICAGELMARCGNSNCFIRISATHQSLHLHRYHWRARRAAGCRDGAQGPRRQCPANRPRQAYQDTVADRGRHAGAERGLLILFPGDEPRITAEATTSSGQVEVTLRQAAVSPAELPESVLHTDPDAEKRDP